MPRQEPRQEPEQPVHAVEQSPVQFPPQPPQLFLQLPEHDEEHPVLQLLAQLAQEVDLDVPLQVVEQPVLHPPEQVLEQLAQEVDLDVPLQEVEHVVEQLLLHETEQLVQEDDGSSSSSLSQEIKRLGPATIKPINGNILLAVCLKKSLRERISSFRSFVSIFQLFFVLPTLSPF